MLTVSEINYLRSTPPEVLVDDYADFCADRFSTEGVPIVIAAHNEERDLPATLLAAALSDIEVMAIVGENGSDDRTAEFARKMGAIVCQTDKPAKVGALQLGTQVAVEELGSQDVLYTDADTLVGRKWAGKLLDMLAGPDDRPVIVSAPSVFTHGGGPAAELVRSVRTFALNLRTITLHSPPIIRGYNMALHFDGTGGLYRAYQKLRPELFVGEERAMLDAVITLGGVARISAGLTAATVSRGDRVPTLIDCFRLRKGDTQREELYDDYPHSDGFVRYDGTNAYSSGTAASA
jgi:hypothetical protein